MLLRSRSTYRSSDKDWAVPDSESTESFFPLFLGTISMNGSDRESFAIQIVIQGVRTLLGLDKHQGQTCVFASSGAYKQSGK